MTKSNQSAGHSIPAAKPLIGAEERAAVDRVLASGKVVQGPEVAAFESEFSPLVGDRPCVAVNSGTSALHLGMLAVGIGPGDEVIVPSFTFAASANAVRLTGATPVFADIEPETFGLDPAAVAAVIGPRTAAIMPVHLYGHPAPMLRLRELADRHGLKVVEDACQAHGAMLGGNPVGALGDVAAFSFYPTKNMTAGEGGMVVLAEEAAARTVRLLRNQGMERQYENEMVGFNVRMTDICAAIGRVQLGKLATWTKQRQRNAAVLDQGLAGLDGLVTIPAVTQDAVHVYHQYTVRIAAEAAAGGGRDAVRGHLTEQGIGTGVYYPIPTHRLPSYATSIDSCGSAGVNVDELPQTELAAREVLSLPVHPALSDEDLQTVVAAMRQAVVA